MLGLSQWIRIVTLGAGLLASTGTTITGVRGGLIVYGVLSFFFDLKSIIPLTAPAQLVSNVLRLWAFRDAIHWHLA